MGAVDSLRQLRRVVMGHKYGVRHAVWPRTHSVAMQHYGEDYVEATAGRTPVLLLAGFEVQPLWG